MSSHPKQLEVVSEEYVFQKKHVRCVNRNSISRSIKAGWSLMTSFSSVRTAGRTLQNRRSWIGPKAPCAHQQPCPSPCGSFKSRTRISPCSHKEKNNPPVLNTLSKSFFIARLMQVPYDDRQTRWECYYQQSQGMLFQTRYHGTTGR